MPARLEFGVRIASSRREDAGPRPTNDPLRILVIGNFSGTSPADSVDIADQPLMHVDIDVFDGVFRRLAPRLNLHIGPSRQLIEFGELDDFHPDRLYEKVEVFRTLRDLRKRIGDPGTFQAAAEELMQGGLHSSPIAPPVSANAETAPTEPAESGEAALERLLGARSRTAAADAQGPAPARSPIDVLLRDIIKPHLDPTPSYESTPYLNAIDLASTEQMRAILHDESFQALESAWRSLRWLVDNLDLDESIRLSVLHVSHDQLIADAQKANGAPEESGLYRRLVDGSNRSADEPAWSLIIGDYTFGAHAEDLQALELMGAIGAQIQSVFISAAAPDLAGCPNLLETPSPRNWLAAGSPHAERWNTLRASAVAPFIGLAMPRILMRLPYGEKTDPIDAFEFDELAEPHQHDCLLWGNPAFACAMLAGRAFEENGWAMRLGENLDLEDLPAFSFEQAGETQLKPCSEVCLSRHAGEELVERGIMPFLSYANRNAVRLTGFRSISTSAPALAALSPSNRP